MILKLSNMKKCLMLLMKKKDQILKPLSNLFSQAIGSMGDDTPFPVLSNEIRSTYNS